MTQTRTERLEHQAPGAGGHARIESHPVAAEVGGDDVDTRRRGGGHGVAALCIGVGQGLAVVLEA